MSRLLTLGQYSLLFLFVIFQGAFAKGAVYQLVEFLGIFLAFWAIMTMRSSKLKMEPMPHPYATLVTTGPYKLIRHPMYSSIILAFSPILVSNFNWHGLLIFSALLVMLLLKLNFEEILLRKHFPDYEQYKKNTFRLIPFIY